MAAAKAAALSILTSGAVGDNLHYQVIISGHSNPGHVPAQEFANDSLAVTVTQVTAPATS